ENRREFLDQGIGWTNRTRDGNGTGHAGLRTLTLRRAGSVSDRSCFLRSLTLPARPGVRGSTSCQAHPTPCPPWQRPERPAPIVPPCGPPTAEYGSAPDPAAPRGS